jgi:hypothetical protein
MKNLISRHTHYYFLALFLAISVSLFGQIKDIPNLTKIDYAKADSCEKNDKSGHGNNATCLNDTCPTWTASGKSGGAFEFNGTQYFDTNANFSNYPLTFSAWIKRIGFGDQEIFAGAGYDGWGVKIGGNNAVLLTKTGVNDVTSTGTITDTTSWHHVAVTYDGSNVDFYIDGSPAGTAPYTDSFTSTGNYLVGSWSGGYDFFNGYIDDLRVYNRVLSDTEVSDIYANNPSSAGLVLWYDFDSSCHNNGNLPTTLNIENTPPSFTADPSDGGSSAATPTNAGDNVTFTATAHDDNEDQYYLAICKSDAITPGTDGVPTCNDGSWAISAVTDSDAQATVTYPTSSSDAESNNWYAFVCDKNTPGACSASSQGSGNNGSPFKVNHTSSFSDVKIGPTCGSNDPVPPGNSSPGGVGFTPATRLLADNGEQLFSTFSPNVWDGYFGDYNPNETNWCDTIAGIPSDSSYLFVQQCPSGTQISKIKLSDGTLDSSFGTNGVLNFISGSSSAAKAVSDGNNGAIISWQTDKAHIQKISSSGTSAWSGTPEIDTTDFSDPMNGGLNESLVADTAGNYFNFVRYIISDDTVWHIQKTNSSGAQVWGDNGVTGGTAVAASDSDIQGISDGNGGLFYVYDQDDSVISARHLNSNGAEQFTTDFALATTGACASSDVKLGTYGITHYEDTHGSEQGYDIKKYETDSIMPDGNGGFIAWWQGTTSDFICAQRVDASGNRLWGDSGIMVAAATTSANLWMDKYRVVSDGAHGAIFVMVTWDNGNGSQRFDHFVVKKIAGDGTFSWGNDGTTFEPVTTPWWWGSYQTIFVNTSPDVIPDGNGGVFINYGSSPGAGGCCSTTIVARLNSSGSLVSGCDQKIIPESRVSHEIIPDGAGGVVVMYTAFYWGGYASSGLVIPSNALTALRLDASCNIAPGWDSIYDHWWSFHNPGVDIRGLGNAALVGNKILFWNDSSYGGANGPEDFDHHQRAALINLDLTSPSTLNLNLYSQTATASDGTSATFWTTEQITDSAKVTRVQLYSPTGTRLILFDGLVLPNPTGFNQSSLVDAISDGNYFYALIYSQQSGGNAHQYNIYKIGTSGNVQWGDGGLVALSSSDPGGFGTDASISPDGSGGVYLATDTSSGNSVIQHIASNQSLPWGATGITISSSAGSHYLTTADGAGGAYIAWQSGSDIKLSHIDSGGTIYTGFGTNGLTLVASSDLYAFTGDNAGNAVAVYIKDGNYYAKKVDIHGNVLWPYGISVGGNNNAASGGMFKYAAAGDTGDIVVTGIDTNNNHLFAQKFNNTGSPVWGATHTAHLTSDLAGGETTIPVDSTADFSATGGVIKIGSTLVKCTGIDSTDFTGCDSNTPAATSGGAVTQQSPLVIDDNIRGSNIQIASDGRGGAVISYGKLNTSSGKNEVLVAFVNYLGTISLGPQLVSNPSVNTYDLAVVSAKGGNVSVAWQDNSSPNFERMQMIHIPSAIPFTPEADFVCVQATVHDSDTDTTAATVDMHVCDTDSFANGTCGGTTLCTATGVASGNYAQCYAEHQVPIPTAHGQYPLYVFITDNHGLLGSGTNENNYTVADVPPQLVSYYATDTPNPSAGGSSPVNFSVSLKDDNGDNDVTNVKGVFFDPSAVSHDCGLNEKNCYISPSCTLTDVSAPGTGKTSLGTDNALGANCSVNVWYNANPANWDVQAAATDNNGITSFADAGVSLSNPPLLGIDITQSSIVYGTVVIGGTSDSKETSMANKGNQPIDVYINGDQMCSPSSGNCTYNIPVEQQKWSDSSSFDWDTEGNALVDTASGNQAAGGCYNANIPVRNDHTSDSANKSVFWKLTIPQGTQSGRYSGQNTFTSTLAGTCS